MNNTTLGKVLKGLYSALVAFLGTLTTLLVDGSGFSSITAGQWVAASLFALTAFGGTFGLAGWSGPNETAK